MTTFEIFVISIVIVVLVLWVIMKIIHWIEDWWHPL